MPLLYYLPLVTAAAFVISVLLVVSKARGKKGRYVFLFIMMIGTGLALSLIEAIIIRSRFAYDNSIIIDKAVFFVLLILLNSFNCLGKALSMRKELVKEDSDYARAVSKANLLDTLGLMALICAIIIFKQA